MDDPILDASLAWRLLRRLCESPRADAAAAALDPAALPIDITADGQWQARGPVSDEAAWLLDLYLPLCTPPRTGLVMAQMGQSLDGRVATVSGASHYVTGPADLTHLHRLRALSDAVLVGAGTVVADDPRLTVRRVEGRNPVRVVIDPSGRVSSRRQLFHDGLAPTLRLYDPARHDPAAVEPLPGVEHVAVAGGAEGMAPADIVKVLAARGLRRLLVEGGGDTVSRFLAAGALHRLLVCVSPMIIGSGRRSFRLPAIEHLHQALRPPCRRFVLGDDVLFDLRLASPGEGPSALGRQEKE